MLSLIVVIVILLITGYLANQGMLSSLLALATSIFSSILAMALMESMQGVIGKYRPAYARGTTFLVLFFLIFSFTRVAADMAVPKNIKLSRLVNRIAGGVVGFFTALVVVGTLLLGVEMLPLPNSILGFDRFPGPDGMQASGAEVSEVAKPANLMFSPDRFVLGIWNGASGRALGGNRRWTSVHPDLTVESYGYRNVVQSSSERTVPADLIKVAEVWTSDDAKDLTPRGIPAEPGKRIVMVRAVVSKGDNTPHLSYDADTNFRVSASQVRLVTDKSHQYYPIGYMDKGRRFTKLTLDSGRVVDDYAAPRGGEAVATEDWIFQIDGGESPTWFEVKQLARTELADIKTTPTQPPAAAIYPQRPWLNTLCSVSVEFVPKADSELKEGHLYVLKPTAVRKDVEASLSSAYDKVADIKSAMDSSTNGWTPNGKPGVPNRNIIDTSFNYGRNAKTDPDDRPVTWSSLLQLMLAGELKPDGNINLEMLPRYMENEVIKTWSNIRGGVLAGDGKADASGKVTVDRLPPGQQTIIYTMLTDKAFYVWSVDETLQKSERKAYTAQAGSPGLILSIDTQQP